MHKYGHVFGVILLNEIGILLYIQFFVFLFYHMKLKAQISVLLHILPSDSVVVFLRIFKNYLCQMVLIRPRINQTGRIVMCKSMHTNQSDLLVHPPYILYCREH